MFALLLSTKPPVFCVNPTTIFESNNHHDYTTTCKEIDSLRNTFSEHKIISLGTQTSQEIAPFTHQLLNEMVLVLAIKSKTLPPEVCINCHDDFLYDAQADHTNHRLIIGAGLIKLFLWKKEGIQLLQFFMLHELAHLYYNHNLVFDKDSIRKELEADAFAIALLDDPTLSLQALNIAELAARVFYIIQAEQSLYSLLSREQTHDLARKIAYAVASKPHLKKLGYVSTGTHFNILVYEALKKGLQSRQHGLLRDLYETIKQAFFQDQTKSVDTCKHKIIEDVYQNITGAWTNLAFTMINHQQLQEQCELVEQNKEITHPGPKQRRQHLSSCIQDRLLSHDAQYTQQANQSASISKK